MVVEHHDLLSELPEFREKIHQMKMENAHFAKLFAEYHVVTKEVENLEGNNVPVADETFENAKKKRALLKDQLYAMLTA